MACLHDRRRYIGSLVLLARTDSTFVRTTQLDNHLCVSSWLERIGRTLARTAAFFIPGKNGGASRDRTDDLKLAKLALSQLSYGPSGLAVCEHGGPSRS